SNNDNMNAIMRALKKLGLGKDEYKTQQFQVHPMWSQRPRNPAPEWNAKIVGYRVTNSLQVQTKKMELAGDIIGAAMGAGANTVNSVQFGLADPREYRAQAIKQAMENAQTDAQTLAAASGDKIKRTLSLNLDNAVARPLHMQPERMMMRGAAAMDSGAPPIEAGDVTVHASVSVVYELE
ncbi:MAG: SIMPL domain-containing protein, partial [Pseudomonadales bacterium]